jgi:hypothetical protein
LLFPFPFFPFLLFFHRFYYNPIIRAIIVFITSVVPATMEPMRTSTAAREILYSSM